MQHQQQRFYIRPRHKLGLEAPAIVQELKLAWCEEVLSYATLISWIKYFK